MQLQEKANSHESRSVLQPTDDIVLMALTLEKIFLQKVAQMPQEEEEVLPYVAKGKGKKSNTSGRQLKSRELICLENCCIFVHFFVYLYEGKNNGSVNTTSSTLSAPPQAGVSNTTCSSAQEAAALSKVSCQWRRQQQSFESETDNRFYFLLLLR